MCKVINNDEPSVIIAGNFDETLCLSLHRQLLHYIDYQVVMWYGAKYHPLTPSFKEGGGITAGMAK